MIRDTRLKTGEKEFTMRLRSVSMLVVALGMLGGCRSGGLPLLNYLGLDEPMDVLIVTDNPATSALALFEYEKLRSEMQKGIGKSVVFELGFPIMVEGGLRNGWRDIAIMKPIHYAMFDDTADMEVLAVPTDLQGRDGQRALLVVAEDSEIRDVDQLAGKKVAFGPADDARTFAAALLLLRKSGVQKSDLSRELLPIPGSLLHIADGTQTARHVLKKQCAAGFIDEATWNQLPDVPGKGNDPARSELRVLARTEPLPDRLLVCSPKLQPPMRDKARAFLMSVGHEHPEALRSLRITGYQPPSTSMIEAVRSLKDTAPVAESDAEGMDAAAAL